MDEKTMTLNAASIPDGLLLNLKSEPAELPNHVVRLPGGPWTMWRQAGLRGSGFPAVQVLKLSAPECGLAADELLQVEDAAQRARNEALSVVNKALDALRSDSAWEDENKRTPLLKALRGLKKGKLPASLDVDPPVKQALEALRTASAIGDQAAANLRQTYEESVGHISQAIYDTVCSDRFREAVIWQNRSAYHTGIASLIRKQPGAINRGFKRRQNEELVANYLQRYCVKNDTIGFFGPVGWASIAPEGEAIVTNPGASLVEARKVYFEGWCIDSLGWKIADDKAIRRWVAPRRKPFIRVEGATLYMGASRLTKLSPKMAAVIQACDGERAAHQIARQLLGNASLEINSEQQVFRILEGLCEMGLLAWSIEVPIVSHPEQNLRRALERIEEETLRKSALEALGKLEASRNAVACAAGNAERLDRALADLEATFTRLTNISASRAAGQTYAARTLVYEDCRRDIDVSLGPEIFESLGPPLSLLLTSANWATHKIAEIYRGYFEEIYRDLARKTGSSVVDALSFWQRAQPLLFGEDLPTAKVIERMLQDRWEAILSITPGQRQATYASDQLRPQVMKAFDAPPPPWQFARYHSPDVMIAASSPEAIRRGDYQLVLGEIHIAINTLGAALFMDQHPHPELLFRALEVDIPKARLMPVTPKKWQGMNLRTRQLLTLPRDVQVAFTEDSVADAGSRSVPIADLVVENTSAGMVVRTQGGRVRFDIIEAVGNMLSSVAINSLKLLRPEEHTPRITIDGLVVCRETWRFSASDMQFAYEKQEANRFVAIRRWARDRGVPRFVFVKVPVETKPFYLDFASPIYVDIFAKMIRKTKEHGPADALISVTEMLPRHEETWLSDCDGQHYTSELRLVVLHPDSQVGEPAQAASRSHSIG